MEMWVHINAHAFFLHSTTLCCAKELEIYTTYIHANNIG